MLKRTIAFAITALVLFSAAIPLHAQVLRRQNLRGSDIAIGVFWGGYDVTTFQPQNAAQENALEWRTRIQREHNFRIREFEVATWNDMQQVTVTSIMSGRPPMGLSNDTLMVYVLQADWAMALHKQKLLFPVSDNRVVDFRNSRPVERNMIPVPWNLRTHNDFTFGNKTYAFSQDVNVYNAQIIFFNKRLFREAGLDPNLPYDLQRSGQWTWERFLEICKQLTRDLNNDGIIDTYALPRDLSTEILDAIVASNGANYVSRNATGKFELSINTPQFMEALQYAIRLNTEGVMKPRPEGTNWNWHIGEFADGKVAMRIDESNEWNSLQNMRDDWGIVLFPKGPRADNYRVYTRENVMVIPASYRQADVEKILYALSLWYTPLDENWKLDFYSRFRDRRAVDETLALIRDTNLHITKNHIYIPGLQRGNIAWEMWHHDGDPSQLVESVTPLWQALIDDVNEELGFR